MGKYFFDTEFWERRAEFDSGHVLELISIGMTTPDGRDFYAVNGEFDWSRPEIDPWLRENVEPHLGDPNAQHSRREIARLLDEFIGPKPRFYAWYADYDWVVFCSLFGRMIDLPERFPRYCRDVKQIADRLGNPDLPAETGTEHNALDDARDCLNRYMTLAEVAEQNTTRKEGR